jgi:hypothetical protein
MVGQPGATEVFLPGRDATVSAAFSPGGEVFGVVQLPGIAQVWRRDSPRPVFPEPVEATAFRFSADARTAFTWSQSGRARLWSLHGSQRALEMRGGQPGIVDAVFTPDSERVIALTDAGLQPWTRQLHNPVDTVVETGQRDASVIGFIDRGNLIVGGGEQLIVIEAPPHGDTSSRRASVAGVVSAMTYSSSRHMLVLGQDGASDEAADASSRVLVRGAGNATSDVVVDAGHGRISSLALLESGRLLAIATETAAFASRVEVVDLATLTTVWRRCFAAKVTGMAGDSQSPRFALGLVTPQYGGVVSSRIEFEQHDASTANDRDAACSPHTGQTPRTAPGDAHAISAIADDLVTAVSGADRELVAGSTLSKSQTTIAFGDRVSAVAITRDGRYFAAGGDTGLTMLFNRKDVSDTVALQSAGARVAALAFSDDGNRLAAVDAEGRVSIYPIGMTELLGKAHAVTQHRRPTENECGFLAGGCLSDPTAYSSILQRVLRVLAMR